METIYIGIKKGIENNINIHGYLMVDINLQFNIDGIPIFKSSSTVLWPILAKFGDFKPFLVALYCGSSKPTSLQEYLQDFIMEFSLHLVCLGVVRRLLNFLKWSIKGTNTGRLSAALLALISTRLLEYNGKLPNEFVRQPRAFEELDRWKATELRSFLLYTGLVALKGILSKSMYKHFQALSIAIRLLCNSNDQRRMQSLSSAQRLIKYFVCNAEEHYGALFCVYNVHSLLHLCDDVHYYKTYLDNVSAFPFENYLQTLKKFVRGKQNPLVQVCKRLGELDGLVEDTKVVHSKVGVEMKNSCFKTSQGIVFIKEIRHGGRYFVDLFKFVFLDHFFDDFIESKEIGIYLIRRNLQPSKCLLERDLLLRKCVSLPYKDGYVILMLLHDFV